MRTLKNSRHEKFAQNVFKGMSHKDAYIEAGFKPRAARANAARLMTYDDIQARIAELHKATASPVIMDVKRRKQRLTELAEENNEGKFGYQRQPNIQAIAEINKMEGDYAPANVQVDASDTLRPILKDLLSRLRGKKTEPTKGE